MDCDVRKVSSNLTSNYSLNLVTDISLNGTIIRCCNVRNGLKQGDAFSCIIFIMAMDPLLKKRGANARIRPERSHNYTWPKTYGYANDITSLISKDIIRVREVLKMNFLKGLMGSFSTQKKQSSYL